MHPVRAHGCMPALYLFDATFELFRAYYSSPEKINDQGQHIGAAEGTLRNIENCRVRQ